MDKKRFWQILTVIITLAFNISAPFLLVNTIKDYSAKSNIVGSPSDEIIINEYVTVDNYIFQENLSKINFVEEENTGYKLYSYYFSPKDFDASKNNYAVFINDYMCGIISLQTKSITSTYTMEFKDISKNVLNTLDMEISFEFYTSYSYLLIKMQTEDMTYFNGFRENPGFILTLSKVNFGMSGLIGQSGEYLEIINLQHQLSELQASKNELQSMFDELSKNYNTASEEIKTLKNQIATLEARITDLQIRIDAYDKYGKVEVVYKSNGITNFAEIIETGASPKSVPTLDNTTSEHFAGWSIDGETVIDPSIMTLTENTTFIAVWKNKVGDWLLNDEYDYGETIFPNFTSRELKITESSATIYIKNSELTSTKTIYGSYFIDLSGGWGDGLWFVYNPINDTIKVYSATDNKGSLIYGDTPDFIFSRAS